MTNVKSVTPGHSDRVLLTEVIWDHVQGHPTWNGAGGDYSTTFLTNIRRLACLHVALFLHVLLTFTVTRYLLG